MRVLVLFACVQILAVHSQFQPAFQWRSLSFNNLPPNTPYNFTQPVPFGIARHKNRMFIGIARRNTGIPVTLGFINLNDRSQDPPLTPYPNYQMNSPHPQNSPDPNRIVSVYRPQADECDRLWFVDTGVLEIPNNRIVVQRPSIWVVDVNTDSLVRRYEIPTSIVDRDNGRGLVSITVDDPDGSCSNTFIYISDWLNSRVVVYSLLQNRAWNVEHNYFYFDPLYGDFNVDGLQFTRRDGVFSVALSHRLRDGSKYAFFHPMCTDREFVVSTNILRNETLATRTFHGRDFQVLGRRGGARSQAGIHVFDPKTRVLFSTQLQSNAVDCWRFDLAFSENFIDTVDQSDVTLFYPVDMILDNDMIWVLSNRMPRVVYSKLNFVENNFFLLRGNVKNLIRGRKCNLRSGPAHDELNLRFDV